MINALWWPSECTALVNDAEWLPMNIFVRYKHHRKVGDKAAHQTTLNLSRWHGVKTKHGTSFVYCWAATGSYNAALIVAHALCTALSLSSALFCAFCQSMCTKTRKQSTPTAPMPVAWVAA